MKSVLKRAHLRLKLQKLVNLANYANTFLRNDVGSWPVLLAIEKLREFRRVLFLAPHQDDEAFSLGGTLSLLDEAGNTDLGFVWFSRGSDGIRTNEARKFMESLPSARGNLGLDPFPIAGESVPVSRSATLIRGYIDTTKPDLICVPSIYDAHMDHLRLNVALQQALTAGDQWTGSVLQYEVWNTLPPNYSVDISTVIGRKKSLMNVYQSQLNEADRSYVDRITALNQYRGMPFQIDYAEGIILSTASVFQAFSSQKTMVKLVDKTQS